MKSFNLCIISFCLKKRTIILFVRFTYCKSLCGLNVTVSLYVLSTFIFSVLTCPKRWPSGLKWTVSADSPPLISKLTENLPAILPLTLTSLLFGSRSRCCSRPRPGDWLKWWRIFLRPVGPVNYTAISKVIFCQNAAICSIAKIMNKNRIIYQSTL